MIFDASEKSAHVEVPLNWRIPQLVNPFESGRAMFTPWLSQSISFRISGAWRTSNGTL